MFKEHLIPLNFIKRKKYNFALWINYIFKILILSIIFLTLKIKFNYVFLSKFLSINLDGRA